MVLGDRRNLSSRSSFPMPRCRRQSPDQGIKFASNADWPPTRGSTRRSRFRGLATHRASRAIRNDQTLRSSSEDLLSTNGSLTFTLKLKRRCCRKQYAAVIESLFADVAEPRPFLRLASSNVLELFLCASFRGKPTTCRVPCVRAVFVRVEKFSFAEVQFLTPASTLEGSPTPPKLISGCTIVSPPARSFF